MKIVIFDLDGTLALNEHRQHFVEKPQNIMQYCNFSEKINAPLINPDGTFTSADGYVCNKEICTCHEQFSSWKPDWNAFYEACDKDEPNTNIIDLYKIIASDGHIMVILSGRSDLVIEKTENWLNEHRIIYDYLICRKEGDFREDKVIKKEMLLNFLIRKGYDLSDVLCLLDDRKSVVEMWRSLGLTCLQVADNNF